MTTIAAQVRDHHFWPDYVAARETGNAAKAAAMSKAIARDVGLTERQRTHNLPKIAAQTKPVGWAKGRRRKPPYEAKCPNCGHELVIEVTR
jgi:hypothetical protein